MSTAAKLVTFLVGLAAAFALALGVGVAVPSVLDGSTTAGAHDTTHSTHSAEQAKSAEGGDEIPGGLMSSQHGYTLALARGERDAGDATPLEFSVIGPDGRPVTDYQETHEKALHLIAVRRDLSGFQHVHPTLGADGAWTVPLDLSPGSWRIFADFAPTGLDEGLTLGADLSVAGDYRPRPLPAPSTTAVVDGYTVRLQGRVAPGEDAKLTFSVTRDGEPVTDLQPYLGAYGHLVALRDGDLAYLHVHPAGSPGDGTTEPGPDATFYASVPTRGAYRLFLDFRHEDRVRTAEFTVNAGDVPARSASSEGEGHDH